MSIPVAPVKRSIATSFSVFLVGFFCIHCSKFLLLNNSFNFLFFSSAIADIFYYEYATYNK